MANENEMDFGPDIYTLEDEEGVEHNFELIDEMDEDGQHYFAFIPCYDDDGEALLSDAELVLLKAQTVEEEELLVSIDDDAEYERIGEIFLARIAEANDLEIEDVEVEE